MRFLKHTADVGQIVGFGQKLPSPTSELVRVVSGVDLSKSLYEAAQMAINNLVNKIIEVIEAKGREPRV